MALHFSDASYNAETVVHQPARSVVLQLARGPWRPAHLDMTKGCAGKLPSTWSRQWQRMLPNKFERKEVESFDHRGEIKVRMLD